MLSWYNAINPTVGGIRTAIIILFAGRLYVTGKESVMPDGTDKYRRTISGSEREGSL